MIQIFDELTINLYISFDKLNIKHNQRGHM